MMFRFLSLVFLLGLLLQPSMDAAEPTDAELRKKPVATAKDKIGEFLRQWYWEGTAAGNVGDWYDNRDEEHSPLNLSPYPQLRKVQYSEDDVKARKNWALQPRVLPHVVFGNSSTSAPPEFSGSNPRSYYTSPAGLILLEQHYLKNNLYIYPEHRDHDPGHNGVGGGFGDLYPTNTPYLIISQGSSGSDQPFMQATPYVLAAFRPDVKKKLVETGLLMPTVQMIFRSCNNHLKSRNEYFTGKAHPTVFEGSWVDTLAMIKKAHEIKLETIPPLVKLTVQKEDVPVIGKDYFEPTGLNERLVNTSSVIARLWRGVSGKRRMVVDASESLDVNKAKLTYKWVVLRGDEKRVQITPKGTSGSSAEIVVDYQERRPVAANPAIESNRVEIGVFAFNGSYYSAPAFITFFTFDSESRTYDDKGRVVEVAYGTGFTEMRVAEPAKLVATVGNGGLAAKFLNISEELRERLEKVARMSDKMLQERDRYRTLRKQAEGLVNKTVNALREVEKKLEDLRKAKKDPDAIKQAEAAVRMAKDEATQARTKWEVLIRQVEKIEAALTKQLTNPLPGQKLGAGPLLVEKIDAARRLPNLWNRHPELARQLADKTNAARQPRLAAARTKLIRLGIIADEKDAFQLTPIRKGPTIAKRLTSFESAMLEEFHSVAIAELILPDVVQAIFHPNLVDARLMSRKNFRDVYHYEGDELLGWTRYHGGKHARSEYTPEGWRVVKIDEQGRPLEARVVEYHYPPPPRGTLFGNPNSLEPRDSNERILFRYENGKRKIDRREKLDDL